MAKPWRNWHSGRINAVRQIDKFKKHVSFPDCNLSLHNGSGDYCMIADWSDHTRFAGILQNGVIGIMNEDQENENENQNQDIQ